MVEKSRRESDAERRIQAAMDLALKMGFTVYKGPHNFFHYSDGEKIGYVDLDDLTGGYNLSVPLIPSKENGSSAMWRNDVINLNGGLLKMNLTAHKPYVHLPKYYENAEKWFAQYWNRAKTEVIVPDEAA